MAEQLLKKIDNVAAGLVETETGNDTIPANAASYLVNFKIDHLNKLRTREGLESFFATRGAWSIYPFDKLDGTQYAIYNGVGAADNNLYSLTGSTEVSLVAGLGTNSDLDFETFKDYCLIVDGTIAKKYSGGIAANCTDITGIPAGTNQITAHKTRLFASTASSDLLYYAAVDTLESWSGADTGFIPMRGNGNIVKHESFFGELLIWSQYSINLLSGSGSDDYSLVNNSPIRPLNSPVGCIAPATVQKVAIQGQSQIIFQSQMGLHAIAGSTLQTTDIVSFDNITTDQLSENVKKSLNQMDWANVSKSRGCYFSNRYFWSIPITTAPYFKVLVLNCLNRSWSVYDFPTQLSRINHMASRWNRTTGYEELLIGATSEIYKMVNRMLIDIDTARDYTDASNAVAPIYCTYRDGWDNMGTNNRKKVNTIIIRLFSHHGKVAPVSPKIKVRIYTDDDDTTAKYDQYSSYSVVYSSGSPAEEYGNATLVIPIGGVWGRTFKFEIYTDVAYQANIINEIEIWGEGKPETKNN